MAEQKKTDLRVIKTRAAIKKAFKEMIMEMPPSDIQVKDLAQRAQIHRKTFYLHYSCLQDLFEDIIRDIAAAYYEKIDAIPADMPMTEVNRVFFEFYSSAEPYVERLMCAPECRDLYDNTLRLTLMRHNRARHNPYAYLPQEEQNIINTFLTKSSNDMYRQWVADGKQIPVERVIALTNQLLTHGIHDLAR